MGVLLFVAGVLMFCGKSAPSQRVTTQEPELGGTALDPARIEQVNKQLDKALRNIPKTSEPSPETPNDRAGFSSPPAGLPAVDPALEREKREREERKASNVVFSTRPAPTPPPPERPLAASPLPSETAETSRRPRPGEHTLNEGSVIEAVLANRLDGTFTGPVNCIVTGPVFSRDGQDVLIPRGARILGSAQRVSGFGQERLAISFHRLLMPNGRSLALADEIGLNAIGEAGLKDKTEHHLFRLIATSAAVGVLGGLAIAGTSYGVYTSGDERLTQSTVGATSASVNRILERFLNVLPTVTIREGHRVRVYLGRDIFLPAYKESL